MYQVGADFDIFIELIRPFDTLRMPRPHKNYNFADPINARTLDTLLFYNIES